MTNYRIKAPDQGSQRLGARAWQTKSGGGCSGIKRQKSGLLCAAWMKYAAFQIPKQQKTMFKTIQNKLTALAALLLLTVLVPLTASAIAPEDVREYGDVFVISATAPDRSHVLVTWEVADGYYLYNNRFLGFTAVTAGVVLGEAQLPKGKISFDDLLGEEVEKYTGKISVRIPLQSVPAGIGGFQLRARSQGCLQDVLCYPPTEQVVLVGLPADLQLSDERSAGEEVELSPGMDMAPAAATAGPLARPYSSVTLLRALELEEEPELTGPYSDLPES